jgi:predicted phosphodiesterase
MLNILITSDLHAYSPPAKGGEPSLLVAQHENVSGKPDIIGEIAETIRSEGLDVDWILCCGDIADKADPKAQDFAWRRLSDLKTSVNAKLLLATVGNHDVDSRLRHSDFDPKGALQRLQPSFPGVDEQTCDRFWSRNFHLWEEGNVRLVNLNSAAFHGFYSDEKTDVSKIEYLHGRVSDFTIDAIVKVIRGGKPFPLNILLTHHHMYRNDWIYDQDTSEMEHGGRLIDALTRATRSRWLVIHGHQHYPEIFYGSSGVHQPVIFSAGSLSATLSSSMSSQATNQFYLITLETDLSKMHGWGPCGVVRAWNWTAQRRWERSPSNHNIPFESGFGCQEPPSQLANAIANVVGNSKAPYLDMETVYSAVPQFRFLIKDALDEVVRLLPSLGIKFRLFGILCG